MRRKRDRGRKEEGDREEAEGAGEVRRLRGRSSRGKGGGEPKKRKKMEKEETVGQFEGAIRNRKRNAQLSAEHHILDFGTKLPKTQTASPYLHRHLTCVGVSSASSNFRQHGPLPSAHSHSRSCQASHGSVIYIMHKAAETQTEP